MKDLLDYGEVESGHEQLVDRLEDFAWKALALHRPGFENDEGGHGQITIHAEEGAAKPFAMEHTEPTPVTSYVEV